MDDPSPHLEYKAPSGEMWRVEDSPALMSEFGLDGPEQLPGWHQRMAGQGRMWEVTRRYFGVAPVLGPAADAAPWTPDRIADSLGLKHQDVEAEVDHAVAFWRRQALAAQVAGTLSASAGEDAPATDPLANRAFAAASALSDEQIDGVLEAHGFDDVKDAVERRLAAARLIEFADILASPESRAVATNVIRQELDLAYMNRALSEARGKSGTGGARQEVVGLIKDRDKLAGELGKGLELLGADGAGRDAARSRVALQDSVGFIVQAIQEYYRDGTQRRVDAMHTAAEVQFLLEPVAERPMQYDPQLVVEVFHAQQHLWEHEFEGQRLTRSASRRLRAAFAEAIERMNEESGVVARSLEDDMEDLGEEIAALESATETGSPVAPGESAGGVADATMVAARETAWRAARSGGSDLAVAG